MLPPLRKTPLLRRCDKIGLSAAIFVLILMILGSATIASVPSGLYDASFEKPQSEYPSQRVSRF